MSAISDWIVLGEDVMLCHMQIHLSSIRLRVLIMQLLPRLILKVSHLVLLRLVFVQCQADMMQAAPGSGLFWSADWLAYLQAVNTYCC